MIHYTKQEFFLPHEDAAAFIVKQLRFNLKKAQKFLAEKISENNKPL